MESWPAWKSFGNRTTQTQKKKRPEMKNRSSIAKKKCNTQNTFSSFSLICFFLFFVWFGLVNGIEINKLRDCSVSNLNIKIILNGRIYIFVTLAVAPSIRGLIKEMSIKIFKLIIKVKNTSNCIFLIFIILVNFKWLIFENATPYFVHITIVSFWCIL